MKKKEINAFKDFYLNKGGKTIIFFGFYLIFFGTLAIMLNNNKSVVPSSDEVNSNTYSISKISSDYNYEIEIQDNNEIIHYQGTKNNIDYENNENKYFFDLFNINQLVKKSKYLNNDDGLNYELYNNQLNELFNTEKADGINKIKIITDSKGNLIGVNLDLSSYLEKEYKVKIKYSEVL